MAIDIKDSTFNVDPHNIPETSDFYKVRAMGRRVIPEQFNELFICSFSAATAKEKRDYRDLYNKVMAQAVLQNGKLITKCCSVYTSLSRVWGACRSSKRSQK
jgi:hypothetical protein